MDYLRDEIGKICLHLARQSKAKAGFGAVLFNANGKVMGRGRNRRSRTGEYELLGGGVDYAVHAEQAAVINALQNGFEVAGAKLYVIGRVMRGEKKGFLSVRPSAKDKYFSCVRCAKMMEEFSINVFIPMPDGWQKLSPQGALATAQELREKGERLAFTQPA